MARRPLILVAALATLALVALPALAGQPSWAQGKGAGKAAVEQLPITSSGTVESSVDEDGNTSYTLVHEGTTYRLEAGPAWFHGTDHPLAPFVGAFVTVEGEAAVGSTEVDVLRVDGTALREPGKPPWAGGWKRVGEAHPGWSQAKADRLAAKGAGCFPPGHCKVKPDTDAPAE